MKTQTQNRFVNVGQIDRYLRLALAMMLILVAWLFDFRWSFWGGIFLLITAAVRICPIYTVFKISSLSLGQKKTVIPWQEFLDLLPPEPPAEPVAAPTPAQRTPKAAPNIVPVAFSLPPELTHALIQDVQKNALDEVLVIRFFENFFGCKISVEQVGHLNSYVCKFPDQTVTLNFAKLKAKLLDRLQETAH